MKSQLEILVARIERTRWVVNQNEVAQPELSKRRRIRFPPDHDGMQDAQLMVEIFTIFPSLVEKLTEERNKDD